MIQNEDLPSRSHYNIFAFRKLIKSPQHMRNGLELITYAFLISVTEKTHHFVPYLHNLHQPHVLICRS